MSRPSAAGTGTGFRYGSDLLLSDADRERAQANYPAIFFALDNPELRRLFEPIDAEANRAKSRSRFWGVVAVGLITFALMISATITHPAGEQESDKIVPIATALAGAAGVAIGFFGVMFGGAKQRWLERRYLTERLRQLQYQMLIAWAPHIVRAAQTGEKDSFLALRARVMSEFSMEHIEGAAGKLGATIAETLAHEAWLVQPEEGGDVLAPSTELNQFFDAITHLRLHHQIDFTDFKLRTESWVLSGSPKRQSLVLSGVALACVFGMLVLHFLVVIGAFTHNALLEGALTHVGIIWLALLALAARTLEEGFQAQREVERYRQYGAALRLVSARFRATSDPAEKLVALRDLEDVAYEEMVNFLKSNNEARFVM
jgi:hypothetical protein